MLLAGVLALLFAVCAGRTAEKQKGQVSVRFSGELLVSKELERIYEEMEEDQKENIKQFTLWKQKQGEAVSKQDAEKNITVKVIELWGDVEQIYPECLSDGNTLYREDEIGCMLSSKAAFALFGGEDVVGKKVSWNGGIYQVRGILDVEEELFLIEKKDGSFTCMEAGEIPESGTEPIRQFLLLSGVSLDDGAVLEWDSVRGLMHMMYLLSFGLLECAAVRLAAGKCQNRKSLLWCVRGAAIAAFFIVFAKSWCFSQDFIPAKWSDFDFFGELFRQQKENYMRYLDIPDIFKDRELFKVIRRVSCLTLVSVLCAVWSFFRMGNKSELSLLPDQKEEGGKITHSCTKNF